MTAPGPRRRGQVVLLAAAALAVAFVPMALAYLQLGYHGDTDAIDGTPLQDTERTLSLGLRDAVDGIPQQYRWSNRSAAISTVRDRLDGTRSLLNTSGVTRGMIATVRYNESRATSWAGRNCPTGPGRDFGSCVADRGVVVQNRANRTHVLASAFDVTVTTEEGGWRATLVVSVVQ